MTLMLFDPFQEQSVAVGSQTVHLASDRTTPLAMQVARGQLASLEWTGLFSSSFERPGLEAGLYMLRPYEPGKIPVVFVHGLFSSPRAWVQTINELQNHPALASRYQFWMFMYPTGRPIPISAAQLRSALREARGSLDPEHTDTALDQMVLVGHSMGGLLSKMMAQDSGTELWNAVITVPRDQFKAPPETKQALDNALIFQRLPFVQRVIFIATPHRGSPIADSTFGQVISDLVKRPDKMDARIAEIEALNGPDVVSKELRGRAINSITNLRTDSPILASLDRIQMHQSVPYHSIIPLIDGVMNTDGVVEYRSSHVDGAKSERIVPGTHTSQEHPEVTRELHRILELHLAKTEAP
jgi:pimeloyl-ACP methyl ester carboxylesterase